VEEAPITRTCRLGALALLATAAPAFANSAPPKAEQLSAYVTARAADALGDPARASQVFAELARERPEDMTLKRRAIVGAIAAGDMRLALELGRGMPTASTPLDLRVLLAADELRQGREKRAIEILRTQEGVIDSSFLAPFVEAWTLAQKRDKKAIDILTQIPRGSALASQVNENLALVYLKLRRPEDAAAYSRQALAAAGGRADRLRLALAEGFQAAGDKTRALEMLQGSGEALAVGRARLAAGRPIGFAIDTPARSFAESLLGLAIALSRMQDKGLPIAFAQVARYADPDNSAAAVLLALMMEDDGRVNDGLMVLRTIRPDDPFASQALDAEIRMLVDSRREEEALRRAREVVASNPSSDSFARLAVVHVEMEKYTEAAEAYGQALAMAGKEGGSDEPWTLRLFRASALEEAGRWAEAKGEIDLALKDAPDNPLLLNFLGYGKLERGEDLDAAEAMVRKASALRPDDASITDSLGWAEYKRGRLPEAIATLQRAAAADPGQAEIQEHLGDALYAAGRRFEARFAWQAALVGAEAEDKKRIEAKIATGLTAATAAP
jgi:tetratricopeptide (TPR) repeat protein